MRMKLVRPSPETVEARKREIARRYRKHRKKSPRTPAQLATLRLNDLARLYGARYGLTLPDDDAGRDDIAIALAHIATLASARSRMTGYLGQWAPWMTTGEARSMINAALTGEQFWTADQLAWRLRLTAADRATLGITTIGAVDMPKKARIEARKRKAREREQARRNRRKATACAP